MGWSCDWDGTAAYRERIAISDGSVQCCESGILIPRGYAFADCRAKWWYDDPPGEDGDADDMETAELLPYLDKYPQAIEVWRQIRNDSDRRGACPSFGNALAEYKDNSDGTTADRLSIVRLETVFRRTRERYASGKGPRLHPHEFDSVVSGEFVHALPFSFRTPQAEVPGT